MPVEDRNGRITAIFRPAFRPFQPSTGIFSALFANHPRRHLFANLPQMPQVDTVAAQALLAEVGDDGIKGREDLLALPGRVRHCIGNISESTLSKQLRELVDDGFLTRTDFGEVPPRVEYALTPLGKSFVPILLALKQWGEKELGL